MKSAGGNLQLQALVLGRIRKRFLALWIAEVFAKDDNALVTGALLNYTLKAPNSATATATAKKTEITILIPAGSQLIGALTVANCTPLKSPLAAKPSTVHVTVTCDFLL